MEGCEVVMDDVDCDGYHTCRYGVWRGVRW